jgi:hypothetical protein
MPTTIYDSSLITQRRRDTTISESFISRIQNQINPSTGSAPLLGISNQSIINTVNNGQMTTYRKNDMGFTNVSIGAPIPIPIPRPVSLPVSLPVSTELSSPFQGGWATSIGNCVMYSISSDSLGNVYAAGVYDSTLLLNSIGSLSSGVINTTPYGTLSKFGTYDLCIVKYNANGIVQWATNIVLNNDVDAGIKLITDSSGNVYITGYYNSSPITIRSFDSVSGGTINTTIYGTMTNIGDNDVFIVKYNTNGIAQWATNISGSLSDSSEGISVDSSGNVYVTGYYESSSLIIRSFGSVSSGIITTTSYGILGISGSRDTFIVKYNTNGVAQWVTKITGFVISGGIAVDSSGNVYATGDYSAGAITIRSFGSVSSGIINTTVYGTLANSAISNVFIVKYNTSGVAQWATNITGLGGSGSGMITVDSSGNVYITGDSNPPSIIINSFGSVSSGTINTTAYGTLVNSGSKNVFIAKYNTSGIAQWATYIPITPFDVGNAISIDSSGNIYIVGSYDSSIVIRSFGSVSSGTINTTPYGTLANSGNIDAILIKYNTNGIAQWVTNISGSGTDAALGLYVDSSNNIYITGLYTSSGTTIYNYTSGCAPGTSLITTTAYGTLQNSSNISSFIVKYNTNGQII